MLTQEHPDYKIKFFKAKIEEFLPGIKKDEYDLVLCFSVLHWLTLPFGFPFVQKLLADLSEKIPVGLFEFALASEFPKNNLPKDYHEFLKGYPFVRVLSYGERHAGFKRPLCFAGNKYAHFDELGILKINHFGETKYGDTHFFLCGDKFVKVSYMKRFPFELVQREILFLSELGGQKGLPKLHAALIEKDETGQRIFFVRDLVPGITLEEKIKNKEPFDRNNVIKQALQWMVFFEQHGYYFGDCLPKNWIYSDDGRLIPIDYEYMTRDTSFRGWPYDVKLLFVMFMNSVTELSPEVVQFSHWEAWRLLSNLKKYVMPRQYEQIATIKASEKFFARLYEILFQSDERDNLETAFEMQDHEILAIEKFLDDISCRLQQDEVALANLAGDRNRLYGIIAEQQKRIECLEKILRYRTGN